MENYCFSFLNQLNLTPLLFSPFIIACLLLLAFLIYKNGFTQSLESNCILSLDIGRRLRFLPINTAMRISISLKPMRPWHTFSPPSQMPTLQCCCATAPPSMLCHKIEDQRLFKTMECTPSKFSPLMLRSEGKLSRKWTEYQGVHNWDGLLDPLDDELRNEILRYGRFVEAAYKSFEFDLSSPFYGMCRHPKNSLLNRSGLADTGYRLTKYLRATSSVEMPRWVEKASNSVATRSSWIGYVAVCEDKKEIARLGRRDIIIAYRGTATCLEWFENLRASLTLIPENGPGSSSGSNNTDRSVPMVESGFLSLYSCETTTSPSLQQTIREEVSRLLHTYADEPLSLTITGHSLGAALATLTAYDIKLTFQQAPLVTVVSFGGPRVGNQSFRRKLDKQGTKVLRIVNSDDVVTKVPGFVLNDNSSWIQQRVENTQSQWIYADVGKELRLNSRDSPHLNGINIAMHHDLKTYLHLVSSKSQLDKSAKTMHSNNGRNNHKKHLSAI